MEKVTAERERPGPGDPVRVFLLDDHEVVRRGVRDLLDDEPDISAIGEAGTVEQALVRVPALRPQVAVLDVRLPDGEGVTVCRELRSRMPDLACLMLTSFDDEEALLDSIMAGAPGYVLKQIQGPEPSSRRSRPLWRRWARSRSWRWPPRSARAAVPFALVALLAPTNEVGSATGVVGATGGLGGFVPPLVVGSLCGAYGSYGLGLVLLSAVAAAALLFTGTGVRRTVTQRVAAAHVH
ncbi:response regulator transcription factor [Streptomyces sp. IMTB 2501]|uniref:response regulator n=1 Tax=Streptomyces sp. IMTB 2501 TaxID=1776340 RepID=UPI0026A3D76E|nr:response regulator [Streptomyces sp. IMTB 2501]